MNIQKLALAGAVLALASPVAALAQSAPQTPAQVKAAALNDLSSSDRRQVENILSLLETNQIDTTTAAAQIDSVLSDSESKAVLAESKKLKDANDPVDAGFFLATLVKPPSSK
jgi:hypothetical protein